MLHIAVFEITTLISEIGKVCRGMIQSQNLGVSRASLKVLNFGRRNGIQRLLHIAVLRISTLESQKQE